MGIISWRPFRLSTHTGQHKAGVLESCCGCSAFTALHLCTYAQCTGTRNTHQQKAFMHPALSALTLQRWQYLLLLLQVTTASCPNCKSKFSCREGCCNTSPQSRTSKFPVSHSKSSCLHNSYIGCVYWSPTRLPAPATALHREVGIVRERVVA